MQFAEHVKWIDIHLSSDRQERLIWPHKRGRDLRVPRVVGVHQVARHVRRVVAAAGVDELRASGPAGRRDLLIECVHGRIASG
jgi:hypothetical protein